LAKEIKDLQLNAEQYKLEIVVLKTKLNEKTETSSIEAVAMAEIIAREVRIFPDEFKELKMKKNPEVKFGKQDDGTNVYPPQTQYPEKKEKEKFVMRHVSKTIIHVDGKVSAEWEGRFLLFFART
jgi:hypothetical protein